MTLQETLNMFTTNPNIRVAGNQVACDVCAVGTGEYPEMDMVDVFCCDHAYCYENEDPMEGDEYQDFEDSLSDVEADAMTLRDAGYGTDEDYGFYGNEGDDY
jgi:hypothetical protein